MLFRSRIFANGFRLFPSHDIRWCIAEERHLDGGRHIHAYIEFGRAPDLRNPTCFDINTGEAEYHPHIQPIGPRAVERTLTYCRKEDLDPLSNIPPKLTYGEIRDRATSADEYLRLVEANYPRDMAMNYDRIKSYANAKWSAESPFNITHFEAHEGFEAPMPLSMLTREPNKSLVVIGPPGCGKTTWAKVVAEKPALFVSHLDTLRELKPAHRSIIFDDMDFKHMPVQAQKFIVDRENPREIHCRYRNATVS